MKKKILAAAAAALLIAAVITVALINQGSSCQNAEPRDGSVSVSDAKEYEADAEALDAAGFPVQYSDRLCGYPPTGFYADSDTAEIDYAGMGYTRKSLVPVSGTDAATIPGVYDESTEQDINGVAVTFYENNKKVYLAVWTDNNFDYTISLSDSTGGVSSAEMTDYVMATR